MISMYSLRRAKKRLEQEIFLNFNRIRYGTLDRKIDFFLVGAQKAGSSALYNYLSMHPQIGTTPRKELHFFNNEAFFTSTHINYKVLEKAFYQDREVRVYGEATPIYMYWNAVIQRIKDYNKEAKIIAILRNPARRAYSHWRMEIGRGYEKNDFLYCIKNEHERLRHFPNQQHRVYSYLDRGCYAKQIERIWDCFPKKQVCFVKYEDFLADQRKVVEKLCHFLAVDLNRCPVTLTRSSNPSVSLNISREAKDYMMKYFVKEIEKVEKLLGWDCSDWRIIE